MYDIIMPAKTVVEMANAVFPFQDLMAFGEVISGVTVTVTVTSGEDPSPELILGGLATVDAKGITVTQPVKGGIFGVIYNIVCSVATSSSHVLIKQGKLAIVNTSGQY